MAKSASRRQQAVKDDKKTVAQGIAKTAKAMGRETPFGDFMREAGQKMTIEDHAKEVARHDDAAAEFERTGSPEAANSMIVLGGRNARRVKEGRVHTESFKERDKVTWWK